MDIVDCTEGERVMDYGDKPLVKLLISNAQFLYSTPQDLTDWSVPPSPPLPVNEVLLSMMKEIERLQRVQGTLIAAFRVNMMRLSPEFTHEEFDKDIATMLKGGK